TLLCHDTSPTDLHPPSLHDALPIFPLPHRHLLPVPLQRRSLRQRRRQIPLLAPLPPQHPSPVRISPTFRPACESKREMTCSLPRSEEHTSELQSLRHLVCRLLLEKK